MTSENPVYAELSKPSQKIDVCENNAYDVIKNLLPKNDRDYTHASLLLYVNAIVTNVKENYHFQLILHAAPF